MQLTTEQKLKTKQHKALVLATSAVRNAWSFGHIKTWNDVYKKMGFAEQYINTNFQKEHLYSTLTYPELKKYLQDLLDEQKEAPTQATSVESQAIDSEKITQADIELLKELEKPVAPKVEPTNQKPLKDELVLNEKNNYGLIPSPNESPKAFHYWFQKKAISEVVDKIVVKKYTGILVLAGTGTGKTFIQFGSLRRLLDINYHDGRTYSHIPYLCITRNTVVEQQSRVAKTFYNIDPHSDIEVINIDKLRSKHGAMWVKEIVKIVDGEEQSEYVWKKHMNPCVIFLDESQGAKNAGSKQTEIIYAYNDLTNNACLVSFSATPFTRVSEAKYFAVSTHRPLEHLGFPRGTVLTNENWHSYASIICGDRCSPDEHNEASIERLMSDLEDYVVRVKGVRPQFEANNSVVKINFRSVEERKEYDSAYERFLTQKAKKESESEGGGFSIFTELLMFAMAAEKIRAPVLAEKMVNAVKNENKAAVCACKFKNTIIQAVLHLEKLGVSRDQISIIWGGGQTQLTKKQKAKKKLKEMGDVFEANGLTVDEMLRDTALDEVEDRELIELPEHLRLGLQSAEERQKEIDKFQSGKSLYCFYTFRAGGVGLSLHHTDELTKEKVRHKESGYAVEEDIPLIPVRPRKTFVAPTYSAIELVQGLGRCPRLTSLSVTDQELVFYSGTIEEDIADIVSQKLRCLSKVVKTKERWEDCIVGGKSKDELIETTSDVESDSGELVEEEPVEQEA